ncbi:MAG: ABC transporter substrate-binding protein [Rhodobacteraceae bacterium]|nr:ABC transporter substrate-binding protein [Paracoccaceae bacterium]
MIRCFFLCLALLAGPAAAQEATLSIGTGPTPFLVRSTTDIVILKPALDAFVAENPELTVNYEQWGSNALYEDSRRACETGAGEADAVFSSAVDQIVELVNEACASRYRSPLTAALPKARIWRDEIWGVTREAAVTIYNTDLIAPQDVPRTRFELLDLMRRGDEGLRGRIATYDIEASGLGYLFAFADSLEATSFGALIEGFSRVDAVATCCSAEIIRGVAEGRYKIAYNVLGSYVATAPASHVGVILPEDYTLYLSRAYMIPRGAARKAAAARLLDFLLSPEGQDILAASGLVARVSPEHTASSNERAIAIEPTLLVARDRQRRAQFVAQWRNAFGFAVGD